MNRDEVMKSIRPQIVTEVNYEISSSETFQNLTLRPLLKLQNDVLIFVFKSSKVFKKVIFDNKSNHDKNQIIEDTLRKDIKLKDQIETCIISLMTGEELNYYYDNRSEMKRRITSMALARLKDQLVG